MSSQLWDELTDDGTGEREIPEPVHILIVEDKESYLLGITHVLEEAGYAVHGVMQAEAAAEFLEMFRRPLIVLVDIGLPDHSGIELMRRIRKLPQFKQLVAMSDDEAREDEAIDAGAVKFLWKKTFVGRHEVLLRHLKPIARTIRDYIGSLMDRLTGLPNDTYFEQVLRLALARARRRRESIALVLFDVDGLKSVNDEYGHQAGSRLITHVGEWVQRHLRPYDIAGRFRNGDEFLVVLPRTDASYAAAFAALVEKEVEEHPFEVVDGHTLKVTVSSGCITRDWAEIENDRKKAAERIIDDADKLMYAEKERRKRLGYAVRR